MHQGECFANFNIAGAGQPTDLFRWQVCNVQPQGFDKQGFRELCQNSLSPGPGNVRLVDGKADRVFQPYARSIVANADFEDRWEAAQKDMAQARLASHVTAHDLCDFSSSPHTP